MKFAKWVYTIAGIYGLVATVPLYWMEAQIGRDDPPAITHPEFFYGFAGVTLAWQVAFLLIGQDPQRFRPLMVVTWVEKFSIIAWVVLYTQQRLTSLYFTLALIDLLLGVLFVAAFWRTGDRVLRQPQSTHRPILG